MPVCLMGCRGVSTRTSRLCSRRLKAGRKTFNLVMTYHDCSGTHVPVKAVATVMQIHRTVDRKHRICPSSPRLNQFRTRDSQSRNDIARLLEKTFCPIRDKLTSGTLVPSGQNVGTMGQINKMVVLSTTSSDGELSLQKI
jgi:hypothetical protein